MILDENCSKKIPSKLLIDSSLMLLYLFYGFTLTKYTSTMFLIKTIGSRSKSEQKFRTHVRDSIQVLLALKILSILYTLNLFSLHILECNLLVTKFLSAMFLSLLAKIKYT